MTGQDTDVRDPVDSIEQAAKLTTWEKEPSLSALKADYEAAKPAHDAFVLKVNRWSDLMKIEGKAKPKKRENRSAVQPKLIRRQAEWRYAPLSEPFLSSHKLYQVKPVTFEDVEAARQNELVLNWQMRTKLNLVKFVDDYVRSGVDEGTVFVRTGWRRITTMVTEQVPIYDHYSLVDEMGQPLDQEKLDLFTQMAELKLANPREFEETADPLMKAAVEYFEETGEANYAEESGKFEEVETEEIVENGPELKIFNPKNVIIDPSCEGDLDKAKFVIFISETCRADLEETGIYKNLDKVNWEDSAPITDSEYARSAPQDFQFKDAARKRVLAYEYWGFRDVDGTGKLVPIVATWIGNVQIRLEENPYPDQKLPLVVANYLPVKRELLGEPDAELLEDNQAVLGALMRGMIDLMGRSANSQQGTAKGWLDPLNKRKFQQGEDYEFNPQVHPDQAHVQHKYPELPQSAIVMTTMMNQDAEALSGVKSFSGGMSGESYGDVAAGIRGVLDASSKREMAILRRFAQGIIQIGEKIMSMNAVFLSEEEVIRVTNEEFVTIKREDLKGKFDLQTDISTAEMDDQQVKDLAFLLQTTGPDMEPGMRNEVLAKIADLKRMPDLADRIRNYKPEPDPLQQKMQELEIKKVELEIAKLEAEVLAINAKTEETLAKKQNIEADTLADVSGVKHDRDLEKQKAQSDGNRDLEITKALTKSRKAEEKEPDIEAAIGFNKLSDLQNQEV